MKSFKLVDYDTTTTSDDVDEDDNEKYMINGKIRQFEHHPGNWACCVYIKIVLKSKQYSYIECVLQMLHKYISNLETIDANDLHISLSRTVPIRYHWISYFESSIEKIAKNMTPFNIQFDSNLTHFTNDNRSRTFVAFTVTNGSNILEFLSELVDELFEKFSLPKYYDNPHFHCSIGCYSDGYDTKKIGSILEHINEKWSNMMTKIGPLNINRIDLKIGNNVKKFYFNDHQM